MPIDLSTLWNKQFKLHRILLRETGAEGEIPATAPDNWLSTILPQGRCLGRTDAWSAQPASPTQSLQLGHSLASALNRLHTTGHVHGAVRADRVWIDDNDEVSLLWDRPRDSDYRSSQKLARCQLPGEIPFELAVHYASPEANETPSSVSLDSSASVSRDLYSLGCLLYRFRHGEFPWPTDVHEPGPRADMPRDLPRRLKSAVKAKSAGDPLDRILAHLLAYDPEARFRSASQLIGALNTAANLQAKIDSPPESARPANTRRPPPSVDEARDDEPAASPSDSSSTRPSTKDGSDQERCTEEQPIPEPRLPKPRAEPIETDTPAQSIRPTTDDPNVKPREAPTATFHPSSRQQEPASTPQRGRRRRRRRSPIPVLLGMLAIPSLILAIVVVWQAGRDPESLATAAKQRTLPTDEVPPVWNAKSPDPSSDRGPATRHELVQSETMLWAPPWNESFEPAPISLRSLPPGPGMILRLLWQEGFSKANENTMGSFRSFAPEVQELAKWVEDRTKLSSTNIRAVTFCFHPGTMGVPETTLTVDVAPQAVTKDDWIQASSTSKSRVPVDPDATTPQYPNGSIYSNDGADVYFVVASADDDHLETLVVGGIDRIKDIAELQGSAISLPRSLEQIWKFTHEDASATILITPNFLMTDARAATERWIPAADTVLRNWLVPNVSAALITLNDDQETTYIETRMVPSGGQNEKELLLSTQNQIREIPMAAERFLIDSQPDPAWRPLAVRLPRMWQFVQDHTRFGAADRQAITNTYVPKQAMAQVLLGSVLALSSSATSTSDSLSESSNGSRPQAVSLNALLEMPMSVAFDQESLESAISMITEEFNSDRDKPNRLPDIVIEGNDLRASGITQNQQIRDFRRTDSKLRDVLTDVMLAANPDRTATGPNDAKQMLVWVIDTDSNRLLVTTREAILNRRADPDQLNLPPEFKLP